MAAKVFTELATAGVNVDMIVQAGASVGTADISFTVPESAVKQADETIEKHELIKCAVQDGSGLTAKEAAAELAEQLGAEVVQSIGNRFVLFRRSHRDDVEHIKLVRE